MSHQFGAPPIVCVLLKCVLTTVELDRELCLRTGEIDYPPSDRMLAPELP